MILKTLLNTLNEHKDKSLLFEYSENQYADTNYHLTEVKRVNFETVDCGGNSNSWKETHLQLWESPTEKGKSDYMTVTKVLDILNRVDSIHPLWQDKDVKVEFGNANFHTSIMDVLNFDINDTQVIVKLFSTTTGCKAPSECIIDTIKEETTSCCDTKSSCC